VVGTASSLSPVQRLGDEGERMVTRWEIMAKATGWMLQRG